LSGIISEVVRDQGLKLLRECGAIVVPEGTIHNAVVFFLSALLKTATRFVGCGFSRDANILFSAGVLTPEVLGALF